jgi:hypothetical protein
MWYYNADHPLRRLFAGVAEQTFMTTLGISDTQLIDYISLLLSRFVHMDAVQRLRDAQGKQLHEVVDMVFEAESLPPTGRTRREYHRHIGDFTLFWSGLFPDGLRRLKSFLSKDHLLDYTSQGKRSYFIASTFEDEPYKEEAPVLRRLSEEFELCAYGLNQVRIELEKNPATGQLIN